jgi:hypothetical protein
MPEQPANVVQFRDDIKRKQREATRLCIELGLRSSEAEDRRQLESIARRLDRALVELKSA